ncbi:RNA polymerase sigma factor [Jiulongibacter sp. NS-SX5]|uniref:RNA polymerase sigma factor n=1 Tax=Jiulongibacter sp. NS-SX5 TaxID=3463854 RepID=UPI0040588D0F
MGKEFKNINPNETGLLKKVAQGNRTAYTELYSNYLDLAYRTIYLFTKSESDAEELVQELFIKIWLKREQLIKVESFKAYLYSASRNLVIDYYRKQKSFVEINKIENELLASPDQENELVYQEATVFVEEAMSRLPQKRKLIFQMSAFQGMSLDEIAEKMGISKNVVKKQLYTARKSIKDHLTEIGGLSYFDTLFVIVSLSVWYSSTFS